MPYGISFEKVCQLNGFNEIKKLWYIRFAFFKNILLGIKKKTYILLCYDRTVLLSLLMNNLLKILYK